ncbi:MAG: dihydrofolate reductase [Oscillospiraceae bacterium]|nr:dihydrofolate reductase [Oscillospiraceae bacterium]
MGKQTVIIPEDRRFFRKETTGGTIIAGRKTFEDFGGVLPNRKNIVLTRDAEFAADGVVVLHSLEDVFSEIAADDPNSIFVAGGGNIYDLFLPFCTAAYVTKVNTAPPSDTYFPDLDTMPGWTLEDQCETRISNGYEYTICVYTNNEAKPTCPRP